MEFGLIYAEQLFCGTRDADTQTSFGTVSHAPDPQRTALQQENGPRIA